MPIVYGNTSNIANFIDFKPKNQQEISVNTVYFNGQLIYPHFIYKMMPNYKSPPNNVMIPYEIFTGIGVTRVQADSPTGIPYWSGEYLEHGNYSQLFTPKMLYNYKDITGWDLMKYMSVVWVNDASSKLGWDRDKSHRKQCDCYISNDTGDAADVVNRSPIVVKVELNSGGYTETITIRPNSTYRHYWGDYYGDTTINKAWDPQDGYLSSSGYQSSSTEPGLESDTPGVVSIMNRNGYAYPHVLRFSSYDSSLYDSTVVWSGQIQAYSSQKIVNQPAGYYAAYVKGDSTFASSPWVGMYMIEGYTAPTPPPTTS